MLRVALPIILTALCALSPQAFAQNDERFLTHTDVVSVKQRPDSHYEPIGMPVRSFRAHPGIEVETRFDDNIFRTPTNEQDDVIVTYKPSIALDSDWSRHRMNLQVRGRLGRYADNENEDFDDYDVYAGGRYDIEHGAFLTGSAFYEHVHEDRSDPSSAGGDEPTEIDVVTARAGFAKERARMRLKLDGMIRARDFDDANIGALVIDNSDRNHVEQRYTGQLGYEFSPNYEAFARYSLIDVNYDKLTNGIVDRDSTGHEMTLGSAVDISGKMKGEVFAGYMNRGYDAPLDDISGAKYGGSLLWNLSALTSLKGALNRNIEEIDSVTASGYVRTEGILSLEHALRRNILFDADIGFRNDDFEGNGREDDTLIAGSALEYKPFRGGTLAAGYRFIERDSTVAASNYSNNRFLLSAEFTY